MWFVLIGYICLMLVIGYLVDSTDPASFALKGIVATGAIAFIGFIGMMIYGASIM